VYAEKGEEIRKKMSDARKKLFKEYPEKREESIQELKKFREENPDANRISRLKYLKEHPEFHKEQSERTKKHFENPDNRKKYSEARHRYLEKHPGFSKEQSIRRKTYYFFNPDKRLEHGKKMKRLYEEHPEKRGEIGKYTRERMKNPEFLRRLSRGLGRSGKYGSKQQKHIKAYLDFSLGLVKLS